MEWPDKIIVNNKEYVYSASPISEAAKEEFVKEFQSEGRQTFVKLHKTSKGSTVYVIYAEKVKKY